MLVQGDQLRIALDQFSFDFRAARHVALEIQHGTGKLPGPLLDQPLQLVMCMAQRLLYLFDAGDLGAQGDVPVVPSVGADHRDDRRRHPVEIAVLAAVADDTLPGKTAGEGSPHLHEERLVVVTGVEDAVVLSEQFLARVLADPDELVVDERDPAVQSGDADDGMLVHGELELFHLELALLQRFGHAVEGGCQLADFSGQVPKAAASTVVAAAELLYRRNQSPDRTPNQGVSANPGECENDHRHDAQATERHGERLHDPLVGDLARDSHVDIERFAAFFETQRPEREQPGNAVEPRRFDDPFVFPAEDGAGGLRIGDTLADPFPGFRVPIQQYALVVHDGDDGMLGQTAAADQVADAGEIVGKDYGCRHFSEGRRDRLGEMDLRAAGTRVEPVAADYKAVRFDRLARQSRFSRGYGIGACRPDTHAVAFGVDQLQINEAGLRRDQIRRTNPASERTRIAHYLHVGHREKHPPGGAELPGMIGRGDPHQA